MEEKKIRLGVFGCYRGSAIAACAKIAGAEIVAACDSNPKMIERIKPHLAEDGVIYDNFDEFINHEMDGCIVANYYCEHVPYAIRLLEKGISVLSECAAAITMAQCVELVRAVEASTAKYMLVENYPYSAACQELKRVYQSGSLGRVVYAEGEYVHPMSVKEHTGYAPTPDHWRNHIPPTYYNTHSLGPIMHVTEAMPVCVSSQAVSRPEIHEGTLAQNDPFALMMCKMSDGSVISFSAWAQMGGHGHWYRINGTKGAAEITRYDPHRIRVVYNGYDRPEDQPRDSVYAPEFPFDADKAKKCGHAGGDYYIAHQFLEVIEGKREPFFNVYRATAMAACGILGWRSCLEGGKVYQIPDFRREEDKKMYENDHISPFCKEDGSTDIPATLGEK